MKRTLSEWRDAIISTVDNVAGMGIEWGVITLLSQIALILLDIRESLRVLTVTDER
jgi:hypothetical protein